MTISTKFYQNWPGFVGDVAKTFGVFWGSQFQLLFTIQNANAKIHKVIGVNFVIKVGGSFPSHLLNANFSQSKSCLQDGCSHVIKSNE